MTIELITNIDAAFVGLRLRDDYFTRKVLEEISRLSNESIVLMDCKVTNYFMDLVRLNEVKLGNRRYVDLVLKSDEVEVL